MKTGSETVDSVSAEATWMSVTACCLLLCACATTAPEQVALESEPGVIRISEDYRVSTEVSDEFRDAIELLEQEKYDEAIRLLKAVTGKTSKFTAPYIDLGIAYQQTGDLKMAEESLLMALKLNATHPAANNELGLVFRKTGRFVEARQVYETLLQQYPDYLPARRNLGVLCDIYIQDLACALEQYEFYLTARPNDEDVRIWVADLETRMK